jgi:hypothetical protein
MPTTLQNHIALSRITRTSTLSTGYLLASRSVHVNPLAVTDFDRDAFGKELFLLFAVVVAGKNADQQSEKLAQFLTIEQGATSPFDSIRRMIARGTLRMNLELCRLGQYENRLEPAFRTVVNLNPETVSLADLVTVKGIAEKTARFYRLHAFSGQRIAALDTYLLLKAHDSGCPNCPTSTPAPGPEYDRIEAFLLDVFDAEGDAEGLTTEERYAVLDLRWWRHYREADLKEKQRKREEARAARVSRRPQTKS